MSTTDREPQRDRAGTRAREKARLRWMFPQLQMPVAKLDTKPADPQLDAEMRRWSVRGEPRTRATFSLPHPADFPGGLPQPGEYPSPVTHYSR